MLAAVSSHEFTLTPLAALPLPIFRPARGGDALCAHPIHVVTLSFAVRRDCRGFFGVPDSLLKDFCAYVTENAPAQNHVITANEGAAVAMAAGHYMATKQFPVVYLQNSGLGNIVNPLMSLAHPAVYRYARCGLSMPHLSCVWLCMRVYACVCTCGVSVWVSVGLCVYASVYLCGCVCVCVYTCTSVWVCVCLGLCVHMCCVHVFVCVCMCSVCVCMCTRVCVYLCVCVFVCK